MIKPNKTTTKPPVEEIEEEKQTVITSTSRASDDFPPFDEFVEGLCSWKAPLKNAIQAKSFQNLYPFLKSEYKTKKIYPPHELVFNAFKMTPISKIKVVIVGQDPYHQPGQAMGMCFSLPQGIKIPSSLLNMYKSIESDPKIIGFKRPKHGDLTKWATQGVFMMNTILTVEDSKPESHRKSGWDTFTDEVISIINKDCDKVIFLLWGLPAQKKAKGISATKHHILKTSHPSGLSFNKGFSTAYHFSKVNELLRSMKQEEIDWNLE